MIRRASATLLFCSVAVFAQPPAAPVTPAPAAAPSRAFSQLYVFGDSYSDTGAGFPLADGPTAVAYLAQHFSIPFTYYGDPAFKDQGLNFSVSGAKTGSVPSKPDSTGKTVARGMREQVDQFAALLKSGQIKFDSAQTMFFFAGGLNDRGTPDGYTRTNEEDEIDTLYALGARRFMVALLPTQIPVFATAGTQFNPELAKIPAEEQAKHPDIRIANSDWGPFFDQVITHPAQYGLTNTTTPCSTLPRAGEKAPVCDTPSAYFYFFVAHPSTAAHKAVGEMLYTEATTKAP
jgi:phospholipase/lecithinase/hemolysin